MTETQVRDFYLRIGASFRDSEAWHRDFEDQKGRSQVLRSGRFGVGVLATFLLGDEVKVRTRHASAAPSDGVSFVAVRGEDSVELGRIEAQVGTRIEVRLSPDIEVRQLLDGLRFYVGESPEIQWSGPVRYYPPATVPAEGSASLGKWRRLLVPDFSEVHWTYQYNHTVVCNGIVIGRHASPRHYLDSFEPERHGCHFGILRPCLSIYDPDGRLPLSLDRRRVLGSELHFEAELLAAVSQELVLAALSTAPSSLEDACRFLADRGGKWHRAVVRGQRDWSGGPSELGSPLLVTSAGCVIFSPAALDATNTEELLILPSRTIRAGVPGATLRESALVLGPTLDSKTAIIRLLRAMVDDPNPLPVLNPKVLSVSGGALMLPSDRMVDVWDALPRYVAKKVTALVIESWTVISWGEVEAPTQAWVEEMEALFPDLSVNAKGFGPYALRVMLDRTPGKPPSTFEATWAELFDGFLLPFAEDARARLVDKAVELWPDASRRAGLGGGSAEHG